MLLDEDRLGYEPLKPDCLERAIRYGQLQCLRLFKVSKDVNFGTSVRVPEGDWENRIIHLARWLDRNARRMKASEGRVFEMYDVGLGYFPKGVYKFYLPSSGVTNS